ncbi:MAG: hypothetical protein LBU60_02810 [Clostridiales bacterium]|jgi:hypothetical protein|nr:hypothetical protein [Clostridiales bacterium]
MLQRKLINSLSPTNKVIHSSSNAIFALIECSYLCLFIFYAFASDMPVVLFGFIAFLVMVTSALLFPFVDFLISRVNTLFFGTYHAPLILSLFGIAIFNAIFWCLGYNGWSGLFTVLLCLLCLFAVQICLIVNRLCLYAIGNRLCFEKKDSRQFYLFKNIFFFIGFAACVVTVSFMIGDLEIYNIGFVLSIIVLVVGLIDWLNTYQYLPVIKLKDAGYIVKGKEKLKDIYKDFINSIQLKRQGRIFFAFFLNITFVALFLITVFVYSNLFISMSMTTLCISTLVAMLTSGISLLFFRKVLTFYSELKTAKLNFITAIIFIVIYCLFFSLEMSGVIAVSNLVFCLIMAVFGVFLGANLASLSVLYVGKIDTSTPYKILTIGYLFSIGLAIFISSMLTALLINAKTKLGQDASAIVYLIICASIFLSSSLIFLLNVKKYKNIVD